MTDDEVRYHVDHEPILNKLNNNYSLIVKRENAHRILDKHHRFIHSQHHITYTIHNM
jgi:hypothetical protein